ncbi:hypothetical protein C0J52_01733 [Blattella germanica]|nr:hypothetical protein C0J52_01733 [Blattella germanica]
MSDSDDTDVLLLIPPDFFLVHSSDSEDSICPEKYTDKRDFERLVVNDLISQVHELESRISVIESNSLDVLRNSLEIYHLHQPFDSSPIVNSCILPLKSHSMLTGGPKFGGSSDNIKSYQTVNSFQGTPVKQKQSLSLPSTPSADIIGHSSQTSSNNQNAEYDTSSKSKNAITIERMTPSEIFSMSHPVLDKSVPVNRPGASHNRQNQNQRNSNLLGEIDQFLESVEKNANPQHHDSLRSENEQTQNEKPFLCGENSSSIPDCGFGIRDFNNLPVREEPVKARSFAPLEKNNPKILKRLQPNDMDQFLRGIGDDAKNVVRPELPNQQRKLYSCGDNDTAVADLGFGLKAFNSLPVREETLKQKIVTPLQSYTMTPEIKGLELSDIEKLLKQMEATQYEIEKKLQLREALLGKNNIPVTELSTGMVSEKSPVLGDTLDSVPDRGFGIRNVLYSTNPAAICSKQSTDATGAAGDGSKLPIHEVPCTKRNISLLGSDVPIDNAKETQISDNYSQSNQSDNTEIEHSQPQHANPVVQDQITKTSLAKRKLELGGDASTIPDLGFGLKSWYQSNRENQLQSQNIPQVVMDNETTQRPKDYATVCENTHVQGDYLPSVPDLGFGLRSLWSSDRTLGSITNSHIPKHSHSVPEQTGRNINAMEYSVLSQIELPDSVGDNSSVRDVQQSQGQVDRQRGISVEEAATKKKVDFTVGSGRADTISKIAEQDYGARKHIGEGNVCTRSKLEVQSSFPDSGLATSVSSGSGNLLSLSELWGKESYHNSLPRDENAKSKLKLEEERYRRQHCEILIHQLQSRLLEEQQKLAVAVQVDKGKDQAIFQLQSAWNRLVNHWKELEEHRHNLASKLQSERETNQRQEAERMQERKLLIDAQKELENMHKKIHAFEAEMSALKEQKEMVQLKLKEEKGRIDILDQQKKSIQGVLDESKKKEKALRDEVKQLSGHVEKVKAELREYYQEQLDLVVSEKLREFQEQLDAAETGLHKELEQREHAITEIASKQRQENFPKIPIATSPLTSRQPSGLNNAGTVHNPKTLYRVENGSEAWGATKDKILKADKLVTSTPYGLPEYLHNVQSARQQNMPTVSDYDPSKSGYSSTKDGRHMKPPWK